MGKKTTELNIFFAYCRIDEDLRDRLDVHLAGMKRQKFIHTWFDRKIEPGKVWENEIFEALLNSDIILLLISPDFIASDYCYDVEMKKAIEKHEKGETVVIPILLSHCDWKDSPFSRLQALPKNAVPILDSKWHSENEALHSVAIGIKGIVNKIIEERSEKISTYSMEIETLETEFRKLQAKVEILKNEERDLLKKSNQNFLADLDEKNKIIQKQKNLIQELKTILTEYTELKLDNEIVYPVQKGEITDLNAIYRNIYKSEVYKNSWPNKHIRELACPQEWNKTNFAPSTGMLGNIIDSFLHKERKSLIYILEVDEKYYIPIHENGIKLLP